MRYLFKRLKAKCSLVLVLALIASLFAPGVYAQGVPNEPDKNAWSPYEQYLNSNTPKKEDMRATWIVTVYNSDWPSTDSLNIKNTEERVKKQKEELCKILDAAVSSNLNAVMFQVRTASDALYKSDKVPWSIVLTGTPGGDPGFDPLQFAIDEAHKRGLELHAWFNPYRVATAVSPDMVNQLKNTPKSIFNTHPEWVKRCNDGVYAVDPGVSEVRSWVEDCVMEVVDKYDIDGVHFDDYFYHEGTAYDYDDKETFEKYNDGFANIGDWRRNNTYKLISELSQKIRVKKPWVQFGVSPAGMWGNKKDGHPNGSLTNGGAPNYDRAFADTLRWANEGLIDYLCPQVYWPYGRDVAPYGVIATWWSDHITNSKTKLYIGMGLYRVNDTTNSTETGYLDPYAREEMIREIQLNTNYKSSITGRGIDGTFIYQSSNIVPSSNIYKKEAVESGIRTAWKYKAIAPRSTWKSSVPPPMPTDVSVNSVDDGVQISWKPNDADDVTAYYAIYRFEKNESININDPTKIVAVVGKSESSYTDKSIKDSSGVKYAVTALDRLHNESLPSQSAVDNVPKISNTTVISIKTTESAVDMNNITAAGIKTTESAVDVNNTTTSSIKITESAADMNNITTSSIKTTENAVDVNNITAAGIKTTESAVDVNNTTATSIKITENAIDANNTTSSSNIITDSVTNVDNTTVSSKTNSDSESYKAVDAETPLSAMDVDITTAVSTPPMLPVSVNVNMSKGSPANMMVKWDNITDANSYNAVGDKFNVKGTVIYSNGKATSIKVTAHVSVVKPMVKYICPVIVRTEQDTAPVFSDKVDVIYTDNSVAQLSVKWDTLKPEDYKNAASVDEFKNPSVKSIKGTVEGTSLIAEGSYIVYPKITSYEALNITTYTEIPLELPSKVSAVYSDGTIAKVNVTWDNVPEASYLNVGALTISGSVEGAALKAIANINIKKLPNIVKVDQVYIKTGFCVVPKLPAKVKVYFVDGTSDTLPVKWSTVNLTKDCSSTRRFTVVGRIGCTSNSVIATVEVANEIVLDDFENGTTNEGVAQSMIRWTGDSVSNSPPTLSYDTTIKHSGSSSLKVKYNLSKVSGTASVYVRANQGEGIVFQPGEVPQKIGFWVYGNNVKTYALRAEFRSGTRTSSANTYQNINNTLDFTGWRYMEYPVASSYQKTGLCITLMPGIIATSAISKVDSEIYIDNLVAVYDNSTKDITEINNLIAAAQNLYEGTISGTSNGQYPLSERNGLKASIDAAISIRDNLKAGLKDIYNAADLLNSSIDAYKASQIASERYQIIDDYEDHGGRKSMVEWTNDGGSTEPTIPYNSNSQYVKNGSRSLEIDYHFENTSGTASAYVRGASYPNPELTFTGDNIPDKIGVWLYGNDKPISSLRAEIRKADKTSATAIDFSLDNSVMKSGWNFVTCEIPKNTFNNTTGLLLNVIPGLVEWDKSPSRRINSTIYIDDLTAIYNVNPTSILKKTELLGVIGTAKCLLVGAEEGTQERQYPKRSIDNLRSAIDAAIFGQTNAQTQKEIDQITSKLNGAITAFENSMVPLNVDKTELIKTIKNAQAKVGSTNVGELGGQYPQVAKNEITAAIITAQKVADSNRSEQNAIDSAVKELNAALDKYVKARIAAPWDKYNIPEETPVNKREMRAAWISTVVNIDWPSTSTWKIEDTEKRVETQKADLIKILDYLQNEGCNAVMFQVRPSSDAFYKSKLAPWSYWLTGKQNEDPGFDPLQFAIEEAHKRNLELHAWVNPYRVSMPAALYKDESGNKLKSLDQVRDMLSKVPDSIYAKQRLELIDWYLTQVSQKHKNMLKIVLWKL